MLNRIGDYEIQAELGRGAFTRVYRAFDAANNRVVAVKVPAEEGEAKLFAPLHKEAASLARSGHRNVIAVYGWGDHEGLPYIVVEYLQGEDLRRVIANRRPLSLLQKTQIMSQVADALRWAHQGGAIHLDIKPCNIMLLPDGSVKLMDFGAVELTEETLARLSRQGYLHANALYASPEQFEGSESGPLADIFSYGVIYHELLVGQNPFDAPDLEGIMRRMLTAQPAALRSVVADCPESLERIVNRALEKDPSRRYQSLVELQSDALALLPDLSPRQAPPPAERHHEHVKRPAPVAPATNPPRLPRRKRTLLVTGTLGCVLAGAGVFSWRSPHAAAPVSPSPAGRSVAAPAKEAIAPALVAASPIPVRSRKVESVEIPSDLAEQQPAASAPRPEFDVSLLQKPTRAAPAPVLADNPPTTVLAQAAIPVGAPGSAVSRILTTTPAAPPPPPPTTPPPAKKEEARPIAATREFTDPKLIRGPIPQLPKTARERGIYGTVNLEATVGKDGTVKDVRVLNGHPFLTQAAKEAVMARRYQPGLLNGQPIDVVVPLQIVFQQSR